MKKATHHIQPEHGALKVISLLAFFVLLFVSCSKYSESHPGEQERDTLPLPHELGASLPLVLIEADQAEFDHMYMNYTEDISINAYFSLSRNNDPVFENLDIRLSVKGNKSAGFDLKSLGIVFHEPVDNAARQLLNPIRILDIHSLDVVHSIRLRNSGNDFERMRNATMIKDISYTQLAIEAALNIDLMYAEQAIVYVNDEFLGIMNIRSESTARGIAGLYGVDRQQITLAKIVETESGVVVEKQNGNYQKINNLLYAIENRNINYIRSHVDIENFIDYIVFQTFIANSDWPHSNVKFFSIGGSKFRFFMYDLDNSNIMNLDKDPLFRIENAMKNPVSELFSLLYRDESFSKAYHERYFELIESGKFAPAVFESISLRYHSNIRDYMPYHIGRYQHPHTMVEWYNNLDLLNASFEKREQFIRKEIIRR